MLWERIGYAALCVIVPVAWGLAVYKFSNLIEKRIFRRRPSASSPESEPATLPLEYHI
jgi:hypothetical protein